MKDHDLKQKSFEEAYDEFLEPIHLFLYVRLGNRERAKDLTQETFMRVWKYIVDGNKIHNMRPFLYTTAYNLFKNELRAKRDVVSLDLVMQNGPFEPHDRGLSHEEVMEFKLLIQHISELPLKYRDVLIMRYIDGLTVKEIAEIVNETQVAVSVRIHRGISKIRMNYIYEKKTQTA